eukprot:CAMPEP_0182423188 /NCGR_PEP_ID=MMETSP1167-20130531/9088_1 /TAXON_ID=2988 /ORGANISM="Mallomonas Sp, Strain CCMP3275" /LENGTH=500 /DNA_ID=CAMNT_0024601901 /DNA_START=120 /DNA_END=1622 /DNA_ORIENTATION=+
MSTTVTSSPPSKQIFHADEYRIGVLGPSGVGKTSICAKFHRSTGTSVKFWKAISSESLRSVQVSPPPPPIQQNGMDNVISVVVKKSGPLGVKLGPHKHNNRFACLQSFARAANGTRYELEKDGRLQVGDILVAINRVTLVNLPKKKLREILENFSESGGPRVLTFIRPSSSLTALNAFNISNSGSHPHLVDETMDLSVDSAATNAFYMEKPSVNIRLSTIQVEQRTCRLELIDIPGHDYSSPLVQSWISIVDGIVAVYSADSAVSLIQMEKRYGQVISMLHNKDMHMIPIVVVCNKCDTEMTCREEMVLEGKTLAEAWGAKFFENSMMGSSHREGRDDSRDETSGGKCRVNEIFEEMIREVDKKCPASVNESPVSFTKIISSCVTDTCSQTIRSPKRKPKHNRLALQSRQNAGSYLNNFDRHLSTVIEEEGSVKYSSSPVTSVLPLMEMFVRGSDENDTDHQEESMHSVVTDIHALNCDDPMSPLSSSSVYSSPPIPAME